MTNSDCRDFRGALARALEGLPVPPALTALSWHEHLLGCRDCRALLEKEEALEVLLATLPEPKLPPELTERLVARLLQAREAQLVAEGGLDSLLDLAQAQVPEGLGKRVRDGLRAELALDALLERDPEPVVPADLAARVKAGLGRGEDGRLERLLELDPEPEVPVGLSQRVLAGLAHDRRRVLPRLQLLRSVPLYAAAAGLLIAALGWSIWSATRTASSTGEEIASKAPEAPVEVAEPDPSLLAVLDMLENDSLWEDTAEGAEVADPDDDLPLLLADTLDTGDEILLAFLDE